MSETISDQQAAMEHTFDEEERDLLRSFEAGEWESVPDFPAEKKHLEAVARRTLAKVERVRIRLTTPDLQAIKMCAAREGVSYQTLISSLIHKYVTGQLTPRQ